MALLTQHVRRSNALVPLAEVLQHELGENISNKKRQKEELESAKKSDRARYDELRHNYGLTVDECLDVLKAMGKEQDICQGQTAPVPQAIENADDVLPRVYHNDGKVLDIIALLTPDNAHNYRWLLGDCKFEIKTNAMSLFGNVEHFQHEIAAKFDNVEGLLNEDQEEYDEKRFVVVCESVKGNARRAFENLRLGHAQPPIVRGRYKLVSSQDIMNVTAR